MRTKEIDYLKVNVLDISITSLQFFNIRKVWG